MISAVRLKPAKQTRRILPSLGWIILGIVFGLGVYNVVVLLSPKLRNAAVFILTMAAIIYLTHHIFLIRPEQIARKLGETPEERRRKLEDVLGPRRPS
jgi:hypothetical protein